MSVERWYRRAVDLLGGISAAARATGTPRPTLRDRLRDVFGVTPAAARAMATACRERAAALTEAAEALDTAAGDALTGEGEEDADE